MNKKIINLLLASVLTVGSAQVFTSCKDNDADLVNDLQYQYDSLEKRVETNEKLLAGLEKPVKDYVDYLTSEIGRVERELGNQIDQFNTNLSNRLDQMGIKVDNLDQKLANYIISNDAELVNLQTQITDNFNKLNQLQQDLTLLEPRVTALENAKAIIEGRLDDVDTKIAGINGTLTAHDGRISTVEALAAALGVDVATLQQQYAALGVDVANLTSNVSSIDTRLQLTEAALAIAQAELAQLSADFNGYKGATDGRLDALESFKTDWETVLPEVQQNAATALAQANANKASIAAIESNVATIVGDIADLKAADVAQGQLIQDIQDKLATLVDKDTFDEAIEALKAKDAELEAAINANYLKSIGYTNLMIEQVLAQMAANNAAIDGKIENINGEIAKIKDFQDYLNTEITKNADAITKLQKDIKDTNDKLAEFTEQLNTITGRIGEIDGRITSIVLQGTEDDVFGSLRLPLGIQSNLLIGYIGEVANGSGEVTFPLVGEGASTYNGSISNALTEEEADVLNVSFAANAKVPIETIRGLYMREALNGNGYLGQVYATINPSSVNVQDPKFTYTLVNSRGEQVTEPLTFKPSDKELNFGYSRAGGNGFYAADATVKINEAELNKIRFHFDDGLKTTVKDILKAPRAHANAQTIVSLGNAVYNQINGFLPAIGVEATWADSQNGDMKVTSNYAIATAVVKPLSFSFLYGVQPGKHIPHIMPAIDKIKDKFNVVFDEFANKLEIKLYDPENPFTIGEVTLEAPTITIDLSPASIEPVVIDIPEITVNIPIKFDPATGEAIEYEKKPVFEGFHQEIDIAADLNSVIDELKSGLEESLSGITESFDTTNEQLKKLTNDIAQQVNDLLSSMQTTVDTTIEDVLSDIQNKVNGIFDNATLNRLVNRLDAVISKLNDMMDNANYYLQPVLLYSANGDYGMVSTSKAMPSVMVLDGNANAVVLKPTTYTYETVVPIYKKYVAVTKVWTNGKPDETWPSLALEANNNTGFNLNMNKVLDGSVRTIGLKLQKGYTYEVFYQAVDYSGVVSGRKYYICVK